MNEIQVLPAAVGGGSGSGYYHAKFNQWIELSKEDGGGGGLTVVGNSEPLLLRYSLTLGVGGASNSENLINNYEYVSQTYCDQKACRWKYFSASQTNINKLRFEL